MATGGIAKSLLNLGLMPELSQDLDVLLNWLHEQELTAQGGCMDVVPGSLNAEKAECYSGERVAIAQATGRQSVQRLKQRELKALKERFKNTQPSGVTEEAVWGAVQDPRTAVRVLDWNKLPADAMAFYRPFHYPPFDQWGIYLLIGPLLSYHRRLVELSGKQRLYSPEVLMHLVLFEVFNHEFFHHLVESTATTLEVLGAARGDKIPLYLNYRQWARGEQNTYPHAPLEEALANAYAYNSLSFISRIKAGYRTAAIKTYQAAIRKHWHLEPKGYRDAEYYIDGAYVPGGAHLLAQLLGRPASTVNETPLSCIAKTVMPNGFTAMMAKPDIPTYLVGNSEELMLFNKLIPAPNEAYTQLFWPYNTEKFDRYVQEKKEEEKKSKLLAKQRISSKQGVFPW
ncbi:hypothetical protein [Motiliproteus sp. SC1-56]|uniref:hypothetical protein n=1 Tax=Motiliproteus sp. SC1-56 TaxID=2799565 RepID=UPI001A8C6D48|nr:hypothetical protein [Motiliproteus sp. SC1-56]